MTGADFVLVAVVAVISVVVFAACATCVLYYGRVLKATGTRKYGLLLWHIVTVAGSVAGTWGLLLLAQLELLEILYTPRSLRLIGYIFFGITTVAAVGIIALTQYRRVRSVTPTTTVDLTTHEGTVIGGEDRADPDRQDPAAHRPGP